MMKILQINAVYKTSSTGRTVWELHHELIKRGYESYIAAPDVNENDSQLYKIGNNFDMKYHALMARIWGLEGYYSKYSTRKLLKWIAEIKPDIIHLRNTHGNYLNYELLFKYVLENEIPIVLHLDDCFYYTGKCTHYTLNKCYKWKNGCNNCPKLKDDIPSWFFDRTGKMWNDKKNWYKKLPKLGFIGVSNWITEEAKQSILSCAGIKERIYNWIDLDVFKPLEIIKEDKFIILGVASSWSNHKGLDKFIDLSRKLSENEEIVLVGDIDTSFTLPANIKHIGKTNNVKELVKLYNKAGVFCQLSEQESFGKVVAESLACGTPVVTIDSTANAELVDKRSGIVLEKYNIDKLYNAIQKIKSKGKENYKCREFAESNFEMKKLIDKQITIYKRLIGEEN